MNLKKTQMSVRDKIQIKLVLFVEENDNLVSGGRSREENPSEIVWNSYEGKENTLHRLWHKDIRNKPNLL